MSKESKNDKIARWIASISLLLAIISVIIQYYQQNLQKEQFLIQQKEELTIKLNPYTNGLIRLTKTNYGELGSVLQVPWEIIFSNNGNRKLSITNYLITAGEKPESMHYSDIEGGIFEKSNPVSLPIVLDVGESKTYFVLIGLLIKPMEYEMLSSIKNIPLTVQEASKYLAKKGTDFYGNKVNYQEYKGGGLMFSITSENRKSQRFWFKATTGKGNVYFGSAAMYDVPNQIH
ncbi:MAG: hypothetical protein FD122_2918 [Stygiobacter sp.]|nr:MAG: hypothetical protein FD122_2918 [Stygiobacter sp.]